MENLANCSKKFIENLNNSFHFTFALWLFSSTFFSDIYYFIQYWQSKKKMRKNKEKKVGKFN